MARRRTVILGVAVVSIGGALLVPSPVGSSEGREPPAASVRQDGDRPPAARCDPQPERGLGPPAGKGKKCASA